MEGSKQLGCSHEMEDEDEEEMISMKRKRNKKHLFLHEEDLDESASEPNKPLLSGRANFHTIESNKSKSMVKSKTLRKRRRERSIPATSDSESSDEEYENAPEIQRPRRGKQMTSGEEHDEPERSRSTRNHEKQRHRQKIESTSEENESNLCSKHNIVKRRSKTQVAIKDQMDLGDNRQPTTPGYAYDQVGCMSCKVENAKDIILEEELASGDQKRGKEIENSSQATTPINDAACHSSKQTRSSTRLKEKMVSKGSMKLPERKKVLDRMDDFTPVKDSLKKSIREPRRLVNNFFKEKSTYNCDRFYTYLSEDDDDEDDFIVDDEDCLEYESDCSEDKDQRKVKNKGRRKRRRQQKKDEFLSSCSSGDSSDGRIVSPCKSTTLHIFESESSTESSNVELNVSVKKDKKSNLMIKSESEEDSMKDGLCEADDDMRLLPKRRNKEREKKQRAAAILRKKRELAQSKLPLDRRKYLEKKLMMELSSNEEVAAMESASTAVDASGYEADNLLVRDSDREFIVSSSDPEDKGFDVNTEKDFALCLEKLQKSRDNVTELTSQQHQGALLPDTKNGDKLKFLKYQRVILDYDSNDEYDDENVEQFFKLIHKNECSSTMIRALLLEDESLLDRTDSHGRKPLHVASIVGNQDLVNTLLDCGANANALDRWNMLSIGYAAYWKHVKVLQVLLKHTNLAAMHHLVHKHLNGMSLLHLVLMDVPGAHQEDTESRQLECLKVVQDFDSKLYLSLLDKADRNQMTPIVAVICEGNLKCLKRLLSQSHSLATYRTDMGGTVLHLAVEFADKCKDNDKSACLQVLLGHFRDLVDEPDRNGFTPLLYATETGNISSMKALLDHGASVVWQDNQGTSALHLAAAIGNTDCVKLLLSRGHPVDILDYCGWPPLLYANFQSCESCVVELMKVKPKQLFVLSSLLKDCDPKQKEKNVQVVRNTILSLANQDAYYQIFNDFIRQNRAVLDEFNYGIFSSTWKAILDFDNKRSWFRKRVSQLRGYGIDHHITVRRGNVLECAMESFEGHADINLDSLNVVFLNEPGICTGPKREFLVCLCNEAVLPEAKLFTKIDDQQFSPAPLSFFADVLWSKESVHNSTTKCQITVKGSSQKEYQVPVVGASSFADSPKVKASPVKNSIDAWRRDGPTDNTMGHMAALKTDLSYKLKAMQFLGRFIAACIADAMYINLQLSKPFIKQILGQKLNHPDDLQSVDNGLYNGMVKWVLENSVDNMEMPFSINCINPWVESRTEEIKLSKVESMLTDENKKEFTISVSRFKLCDSISREVKAFKTGFNQELSQDLVSVFTPDEFSLLMNGVQHIDVDDWKQNTEYNGWNCDDKEIIWFWETVEGLKQEEKALLLKFSTGSPCVPSGGFKELEGYNGRASFTIARGQEHMDSIPTAATCFNMLRLSNYSSKKQLREKVLIAIRHGSEGFAFA